MDRTQFTFYESFYKAISRIKDLGAKAQAYDAICAYALYGREPDMESLNDFAAISFELIKPNLDASRRKAENGKAGGKSKRGKSKDEANDKQTESKKEKENESENEIEEENKKENENEKESYKDKVRSERTDYKLFMDVYNSSCSNLPSCRVITEKREKAIKAFLKDFTVEQWKEVCQIANSSNFLIGQNDRGWKADIDFLLKPDKAAKILEGTYKNIVKQNQSTPDRFAWIDQMADEMRENGGNPFDF